MTGCAAVMRSVETWSCFVILLLLLATEALSTTVTVRNIGRQRLRYFYSEVHVARSLARFYGYVVRTYQVLVESLHMRGRAKQKFGISV
jgi:hypothetical protein